MKVNLLTELSDRAIDLSLPRAQRQLSIVLSALAEDSDRKIPLNLCLILDRSGSMSGRPLETVKKAAQSLVDQLTAQDRLSIVAFNHQAQVLLPNQSVDDRDRIKQQIEQIKSDGGTSIDEGLKLGIQESAVGKGDRVSHIFLLTDGENEHGDNDRVLKLATVAAEYSITLHALGFGNHWNQDILEAIADSAGGSLGYIEKPEQAVDEFKRLFDRMQSVGLTNSFLGFELAPGVQFAEFKPIAQVEPETVELALQKESNHQFLVRLGDVMTEQSRVVLANLYLEGLPQGIQTIATVQLHYDNPALGQTQLRSDTYAITIDVQAQYQAQPSAAVQKSVLTLAKYRQTQIAETKLQAGDRKTAATLLQSAAKTALQLGDATGATILQNSATRLHAGEDLS
jgi:Ca-activated chloride channel family protein